MIKRDRVTDVFGLVHVADRTTTYIDTGNAFVQALCGYEIAIRSAKKTSEQLPLTCFACVDVSKRSFTHVTMTRFARGRRSRR